MSEIEPGMSGPVGQGIEGADDILEADRERAQGEPVERDFDDEFGQDDSAAAEQGNRSGDEMASEGDDADEVSDLAGDDGDVDDLGVDVTDPDTVEELSGLEAGLDGTVDGADPLAGETF